MKKLILVRTATPMMMAHASILSLLASYMVVYMNGAWKKAVSFYFLNDYTVEVSSTICIYGYLMSDDLQPQ